MVADHDTMVECTLNRKYYIVGWLVVRLVGRYGLYIMMEKTERTSIGDSVCTKKVTLKHEYFVVDKHFHHTQHKGSLNTHERPI